MKLSIKEHASSSYPPRTKENAALSDLTVAFAFDFTTAGEKLTRKAAAGKYMGFSFDEPVTEVAVQIREKLARRSLKKPILNIAGNGIYTCIKKGWVQDAVNTHVFRVVSLVHRRYPLSKIISGGQTGVDLAGIVAAVALGIDASILMPKGFKQRDAFDQDMYLDKDMIRSEIKAGIVNLRRTTTYAYYMRKNSGTQS